MPSRNDGAVVLLVKCSAAEIHHPHCCALHRTLVSLLAQREGGFSIADADMLTIHTINIGLVKANDKLFHYLLHIVCDCEVRVDKENVFWFQICVGQFVFMQICRGEIDHDTMNCRTGLLIQGKWSPTIICGGKKKNTDLT